MTMRRFLFFAAVLGIFAHDGSHAQTVVSPTQIACPPSAVPMATISIPQSVTWPQRSRLACLPLDPKAFFLDTTTTPPTVRLIAGSAPPPFTSNFVDSESPGGPLDGVNVRFFLTSAPNPDKSLQLFQNGRLLKLYADYGLIGNIISFDGRTPPATGDILLAFYRH